jgi:hypothetical protein
MQHEDKNSFFFTNPCKTTKRILQKIQTCAFAISDSLTHLWGRAGQESVAEQILRRKWDWIGHTCRKPEASTTRQALTKNLQGKRKRDRPCNSWR